MLRSSFVPRLVLASASVARRRLLEQAGFAPEIIVSGVDEDDVHACDVDELVLHLACAKAAAVAAPLGAAAAMVIGCDSLLDVDGVAYGKPADVDAARQQLQLVRGRAAVLRTGHCVIDTSTGRQAAAVRSTFVHFAHFSDDELERYLATDEPLAVAGAFTLDGRAAPFIERIDGDHGNVIGLSLPLLRVLFAQLDRCLIDHWT